MIYGTTKYVLILIASRETATKGFVFYYNAVILNSSSFVYYNKE